jgi:NAD(P)-dependent dehydrogenase (short-subunit alcohol dehydrogenase family)
MLTRDYSGSRAYAQSELAQIMFTIDLARELESSGVTVNSLHPATYMNLTACFGDPGLSPTGEISSRDDRTTGGRSAKRTTRSSDPPIA